MASHQPGFSLLLFCLFFGSLFHFLFCFAIVCVRVCGTNSPASWEQCLWKKRSMCHTPSKPTHISQLKCAFCEVQYTSRCGTPKLDVVTTMTSMLESFSPPWAQNHFQNRMTGGKAITFLVYQDSASISLQNNCWDHSIINILKTTWKEKNEIHKILTPMLMHPCNIIITFASFHNILQWPLWAPSLKKIITSLADIIPLWKLCSIENWGRLCNKL